MNWKSVTSENDLNDIVEKSFLSPVLLFKHSTRCSISSMAKNRLEKQTEPQSDLLLNTYLIDLLNYRNVSNAVEKTFNIQHESPQAFVIKEGKVIYHESHLSINTREVLEKMEIS